MDLESFMLDEGFKHTNTGGGCTAYQKQLDDETYILITRKDDPSAPTEMNEPITIGYYNIETENLIKTTTSTIKELQSQPTIFSR